MPRALLGVVVLAVLVSGCGTPAKVEGCRSAGCTDGAANPTEAGVHADLPIDQSADSPGPGDAPADSPGSVEDTATDVLPPATRGEACDTAARCASGFCVDGVC